MKFSLKELNSRLEKAKERISKRLNYAVERTERINKGENWTQTCGHHHACQHTDNGSSRGEETEKEYLKK